MPVTSLITAKQAQDAGHEFWELRFTPAPPPERGWGFHGTLAVPTANNPANVFPFSPGGLGPTTAAFPNSPILPPITGVAVGPNLVPAGPDEDHITGTHGDALFSLACRQVLRPDAIAGRQYVGGVQSRNIK